MASSLFNFLCLLLLLLPLPAISQAYRNISSGDSISATEDENPSWVSPSGEFAFGFYLLPNRNLFLLAIWFNKLPEKTLVWSADRNTPVQKGSKVELTEDGRLILNDHRGEEIWKAEVVSGIVTSAAMLDNGNFVLTSTDSGIRWESFSQPTDTILPSQTLNRGSVLSSRLADADYSKGRFQLRLEGDGDLVLYQVNLMTDFVYGSYWPRDTKYSGSQLIFNNSGDIYFMQTNGTMLHLYQGNEFPTSEFYHRSTLDFDGVFRQYVYPKNQSVNENRTGSWSIIWYEPREVCKAIESDKGSGACGFNSYCKQLYEDQMPSCECPPGYSYFDPNNKSGGCKQDFIPQSCEAYGSKEADQFEMKELDQADWPLSDFEQYYPINISKCEEACLGDCLCAVAIFIDGWCWKKKLPLSNGKMYEGINRVALIKVRRRNSTSLAPLTPPGSATGKRRNPPNLVLILSLILGGSVFLLLSAISSFVFCSFRKKRSTIQPDSTTMFTMNLRSFTYNELHEITDGFKEELGSGGFGTVYKGVFASEYGNFVAVKKLNTVEIEAEKEFETEVKAIGRTHHKNLVQLIGFCNEGLHRLLVYEYMRNGSLARFLFGSSKPDWNLRKKIAKGIAKGLSYLHEECRTQIIHCDIKPQNILLDDCFIAKISDFGISKLLKTDQTRTRTGIRGTKGYLAPEWFKTRAVSVKVDVYSFGVVLLEIICCRKNIEVEIGNEEEIILTDWAYDCYKERRLELLVEEEEALKDGLWVERLVKVAVWCIQEDPCMRPSMSRVTQMIDGSVEVNDPPDPSYYVR
ncbi:G-type lectin S-receptor-like serine/threonine-protein kinase LECRK3 [Magnolia sinica]|uniref:G-type lectin S-receptor-like serine/threonine-protein kinase LECRK3 n=1 Tax=Magnolia sinica TaxID=86752 RepID=UPI00265908A9|nr:G-type lectin S-receptor-like serine/threonine-protein kinase LECRK3 [Magnolia sinica]